MWSWPASGLETSFVLLVQLALFVIADLIVRKYSNRLFFLYICLAAIAILLRADGFVFVFLSSMIFGLRKNYRCFFSAVVIIVVFTMTYITVRYYFYGDFLPNTYYAKVSGSLFQRFEAAGHQLGILFKNDAFFLYFIPIILGALQFFNKLRMKDIRSAENIPLIPCISLVLLTYWFYIGGDVYYERFLLILVPLSIIYIVLTLPSKWYMTVLVCFFILQTHPFISDSRFNYQIEKYDLWIELGKFLAKEHPQSTLAIDAAGKVPFHSRLYTLDMLGLNNSYIGKKPASFFKVGHNKYDPDYVFAQQPDLIAAWGMKDLNLGWGITRAKYLSDGYNLKYIVNSGLNSRSRNIIDVEGLEIGKIKSLYEDGYTYFVISNKRSGSWSPSVCGP
jgi:hypothetical protein